MNEIFPGWVLAQNIFMLKRNEAKYQKRNKARREQFVFEVFRPEIMDLVRDAHSRLVDAADRAVYTDKEIPGHIADEAGG